MFDFRFDEFSRLATLWRIRNRGTQAVERCGRNVGADDLESVPSSAHLLGVCLDGGDVRQRDLKVAPQRPQLVEPFDLEDGLLALDRDLHQPDILMSSKKSKAAAMLRW
jgi:hypothetical protein